MSSRATRVAPLALLLALVACDRDLPTSANASLHNSTSSVVATAPWAQVVDGRTGPGSTYRLYMPADWNGNLVVYAHGIIPPFVPAALAEESDSIARIFGEGGYAVALSSYSETGLAVKDGVQRTHQLRGLFASRFGKPARTYLAGRSLGGYVVTALAERYPRQYDGVLPFCGVVGGFPAELDYVFNVRLLFDHFYPGTLPGTIDRFPLPADPFAALGPFQAAAVGAIMSDTRPLPGALQIALIDQTRMPLPATAGGPLNDAQFGAFVVTPLLLHAIFVDDFVAHTQGHMPFTNVGTTYRSTGVPFMAGPLAALNASVTRVAGDRDAMNWMRHNGDTSGELAIPMLSMHTRYDTWVPIQTEAIYQAKVAAAGHANQLVQRTTEGWDHCNFSSAELATGMADLARWVEQGVKPAP
jgi:pimeloyl-ACP methyl ester carboxylesterase